MNNKVLFAHIAFLLSAFISFTGCSDDKDFKEVDVTAVNSLYEPVADKIVNLQPSATATLYFEWEKAVAQDNGLVYYDVVFDKEEGDFANPIYVVTADNKGISSGASITHKVLNKIAGLAGIESGKQGAVKWTVMSSRGLTKTMAKESRNLTITRLNGIDTPDALFITGEGSEGGDNLSKALSVKALEGGNEYEIFTKLTANKTYYFVDSKTNVSRTFSISEKSFKEDNDPQAPAGTTVSKDGVYKIHLDFSTGSVVMFELQKVGIFYCDKNEVTNYFNYIGAGEWKLENYNVIFEDKGGWQEDRYKFLFTFDSGEEYWGQVGDNDSRPNLADESYFNMKPVANDQWTGKFKFANDFFDATNMKKSFVDVTVSLTASGPYTHKMVLRK